MSLEQETYSARLRKDVVAEVGSAGVYTCKKITCSSWVVFVLHMSEIGD